MRIVAAVAHYDEPPGWLERLRMSLGPVVDGTVELDGRWALMPGPGECRWPSQVAKRDELMRLAGAAGEWILVVDGDEYVESFDTAGVRAALAGTRLDVAEVRVRILNRRPPLSHLASMTAVRRRLFRAGTRVPGPAHYDYARDGLCLDGDPAAAPVAAALDLTGLVTVAHDNRSRPPGREQAAQAYRRARRATRVEAPCR